MSEKIDPTNMTLSQESELNAKAASLESFDQKMAFETYYKMGDGRSFAKAGKQIGRSIKTVEEWASKYRWTARVKERERQAAEFLLMQRSAEQEAKTKEKHLTLIDATVTAWSKKLIDGQIRLKSVEDLERLIRLRWDLTDKPEKRVNPLGVQGGNGMIDLRLRNMEREELQKFLHGTMASISRIMNKKPLAAPKGAQEVSSQKIDMNISIEMPTDEAAPQLIDVTPRVDPHNEAIIDLPDDFADLNLDLSDIKDIE